jgi:toxin-antitoxin system PIN domain toxin
VTVHLADGNLLVALTVVDHVHHRAAVAWFERSEPELATCPITQGTLLRFLIREGQPAPVAVGVLEAITAQDWHQFWPDDVPYRGEYLLGVIGHRQVTDAYLVALAREHGGAVATFDRGLAALHGDDVTLVTP